MSNSLSSMVHRTFARQSSMIDCCGRLMTNMLWFCVALWFCCTQPNRQTDGPMVPIVLYSCYVVDKDTDRFHWKRYKNMAVFNMYTLPKKSSIGKPILNGYFNQPYWILEKAKNSLGVESPHPYNIFFQECRVCHWKNHVMICEVFHCVNCPFKFVTVLDECISNFGTLHY